MGKEVANPDYKPLAHPASPFQSFKSFYPFYLGEHSSRPNRLLHLIGTTAFLLSLSRATISIIALQFFNSTSKAFPTPWQIKEISESVRLALSEVKGTVLKGIFTAYFCAWLGHFFVEKNRPATFKYPIWSLRGDFRMLFEVLTLQRSI